MTLARQARARGIDMRVCAPALIPRKPTDRIKTDNRDAENLARQLAAGGLSFVRVRLKRRNRCEISCGRARAFARTSLGARHRLSKFLLRRDVALTGRRSTCIGSASCSSAITRRR